MGVAAGTGSLFLLVISRRLFTGKNLRRTIINLSGGTKLPNTTSNFTPHQLENISERALHIVISRVRDALKAGRVVGTNPKRTERPWVGTELP